MWVVLETSSSLSCTTRASHKENQGESTSLLSLDPLSYLEICILPAFPNVSLSEFRRKKSKNFQSKNSKENISITNQKHLYKMKYLKQSPKTVIRS